MNIKYQDISDAMREKIRSGVWGPGQRLPIRSELVKQYNTTVATLQKAMDELSADGFIISAGKRGTFVANEPPNFRKRLLPLGKIRYGRSLSVKSGGSKNNSN